MISGKTASQCGQLNTSRFLAVALLFVILSKVIFLVFNKFPLNDGGLFVQFIREVSQTFPNLPTEVHYNGLTLPFAYPPLSFWLGALLTKAGFSSIEIVRVSPVILNLVYFLLFALILLRSGRSRLFTALAILFMSVTLRAHEWLVMGGGLSRGLGSVFLLLTLIAIQVPEQGERKEVSLGRSVVAGILVGAAVLSHLEWGILAAGSVVLSRLVGSASIKGLLLSTVTAGAAAAGVVLPWLLFVYGSHGVQPFLSAAGTSQWGLGSFSHNFLDLITVGLGNIFIFVGAAALLARRQWFWLVFLVMCAVLTPRHALTPQMLPISVFAAHGYISAYDFAGRFVRSKTLLVAGFAALLGFLLLHASYRAYRHSEGSLRALPQDARAAMAWVSSNQQDKSFAIVSGRSWQTDATAEWFPILASAVSVTTVQGREWNGQFTQWEAMTESLRKSGSCAELKRNLALLPAYDFLWVEAQHRCFAGSGARPVFRNKSVAIYPAGKSHGSSRRLH